MKRKLLLLTILACAGFKMASAQQHPFATSGYLNAGNIKAPVFADGPLFWHNSILPSNSNYSHQWEAPKNSGKSTIFAANLWIGGKDQANTLYLATETFRQYSINGLGTNHSSFFFGPVANNYNASFDTRYNKVWKVTSAQIEYHQQNYRRRLYRMPDDIANWPAHGDVTNGEAPFLAPFADVNQNGIYDPLNGDHPIIRGTESLYFILNEARFSKTPFTPAMNLEIHGMAYAFDNPQDSALQNSIFINYRIINRSARNYNDFYAGIWTDFDIGNFSDDHVGCDVGRNAYFGYNAEPYDSSYHTASVYIPGYGSAPPAQGVAFLGDANMSSFVYSHHSQDNRNGTPSVATDYYNYLRGIRRDNKPFTFGGFGLNSTSQPYRYMFPGETDPAGLGFETPQSAPFSWSMANLDGNGEAYKGDVRCIGSIGPFNLNAGQEICFDVAFPFAQGNDHKHSVRVLKGYIDQLNQFHTNTYGNNCLQNLTASNPPSQQRHAFESFFPNPAAKEVTLQFDQRLTDEVTITVYDISGRKQSSKQLKKDSAAEQTLNLAGLAPGVYILNLVDGTSSEKIRLVITE